MKVNCKYTILLMIVFGTYSNSFSGGVIEWGADKTKLMAILNTLNKEDTRTLDLNEVEEGLNLVVKIRNNRIPVSSKQKNEIQETFKEIHIDVNRVKNPTELIRAYRLVDMFKTNMTRSTNKTIHKNATVLFKALQDFMALGGLGSILTQDELMDMQNNLGKNKGKIQTESVDELVYNQIVAILEALGEDKATIIAFAEKNVSDNDPRTKISRLVPVLLNIILSSADSAQIAAAAGLLTIDTTGLNDLQITTQIRREIKNITGIAVPPTARTRKIVGSNPIQKQNLKDYQKLRTVYNSIENSNTVSVFAVTPLQEDFVANLDGVKNAIIAALQKDEVTNLQNALKLFDLPDLHDSWSHENLKSELQRQVDQLYQIITNRLLLVNILVALGGEVGDRADVLQLKAAIYMNLKTANKKQLEQAALLVKYEGGSWAKSESEEKLIEVISERVEAIEYQGKTTPTHVDPKEGSILPKISAAGKIEFEMLRTALSILDTDPNPVAEPTTITALGYEIDSLASQIDTRLKTIQGKTASDSLVNTLNDAATALHIAVTENIDTSTTEATEAAKRLVQRRNSLITAIKSQVPLLKTIGVLKTALYAFTQEQTASFYDLVTKQTAFDNFVGQIKRQANISLKEYNRKNKNNTLVVTDSDYISLKDAATILGFKDYIGVVTPVVDLQKAINDRLDKHFILQFEAEAKVVVDMERAQPDDTTANSLAKEIIDADRSEFTMLNNALGFLKGENKKELAPQTVQGLKEKIVTFENSLKRAVQSESSINKLRIVAYRLQIKDLPTDLTAAQIKEKISDQVDKLIAIGLLRAVLLALGSDKAKYSTKGLLNSTTVQNALNKEIDRTIAKIYAAYQDKHKGKAPVRTDTNYKLLENAATILEYDPGRTWFLVKHTATINELKNYINSEVAKLMKQIEIKQPAPQPKPKPAPVKLQIALSETNLTEFNLLNDALGTLAEQNLSEPTTPLELAQALRDLAQEIREEANKIGLYDNKDPLLNAAHILSDRKKSFTTTNVRTFIDNQSLLLANFGILKDIVLVLGYDKVDDYQLTYLLGKPTTQLNIIVDTIKNKLNTYKYAAKGSIEYQRLALASEILKYKPTGYEEASAFIDYINRNLTKIIEDTTKLVTKISELSAAQPAQQDDDYNYFTKRGFNPTERDKLLINGLRVLGKDNDEIYALAHQNGTSNSEQKQLTTNLGSALIAGVQHNSTQEQQLDPLGVIFGVQSNKTAIVEKIQFLLPNFLPRQ